MNEGSLVHSNNANDLEPVILALIYIKILQPSQSKKDINTKLVKICIALNTNKNKNRGEAAATYLG